MRRDRTYLFGSEIKSKFSLTNARPLSLTSAVVFEICIVDSTWEVPDACGKNRQIGERIGTFFLFRHGSHSSQAGLKPTYMAESGVKILIFLPLSPESWFTGVYHHLMCVRIKPKRQCVLGKYSVS